MVILHLFIYWYSPLVFHHGDFVVRPIPDHEKDNRNVIMYSIQLDKI